MLGFHLVFGVYGFWLPNDPRGSWSTYVGSSPLRQFGPATKISNHRSVSHAPHDRQLRLAAKSALHLPPVHFTGVQAREVARGFRQAIEESRYIPHACAILPDHAHLVFAWHERNARQIIGHLKARATQALNATALHPFMHIPEPKRSTPWVERGWAVFLDDDADMRRAIKYVEDNPLKEGKPRQRWSFVVPYPTAGKPAG